MMNKKFKHLEKSMKNKYLNNILIAIKIITILNNNFIKTMDNNYLKIILKIITFHNNNFLKI